MIYITRLGHLEQFGVIPLTGEADALGLRVLCDVTKRGQKAICEALGIKPEGFHDPWNSGSAGSPHVWSIMLDPYQFTMIAVICLLEKGCDQVLVFDDGSVWGSEQDERIADEGHVEGEKWIPERVWYRDKVKFPFEHPWPRRIIQNNRKSHRNEHAMTGRTV